MSDASGPGIVGFVFDRLLGSGGFADVYLYQDLDLRRLVAIKVLRSSIDDADTQAAFVAESQLMAQVSGHPYIVQIYANGVASDGRPYLVMQYYPGESYAHRIRTRTLPVSETLEVGVHLASALETAHRAGIVHRDVKPSNILSDRWGKPGLTDFGIAGAVSDGSLGFSPPYAAPEVVVDETAGDISSDVFSLAATLYALLTGRSPFETTDGENTRTAVTGRVLNNDPFPISRPDVAPMLERLLTQALSKDPALRPSSALAFGRSLQAIQQTLHYTPTPLTLEHDQPATPIPPVGYGEAEQTRYASHTPDTPEHPSRPADTDTPAPTGTTGPPPDESEDATLAASALCSSCGLPLSQDASFCPHCGQTDSLGVHALTTPPAASQVNRDSSADLTRTDQSEEQDESVVGIVDARSSPTEATDQGDSTGVPEISQRLCAECGAARDGDGPLCATCQRSEDAAEEDGTIAAVLAHEQNGSVESVFVVAPPVKGSGLQTPAESPGESDTEARTQVRGADDELDRMSPRKSRRALLVTSVVAVLAITAVGVWLAVVNTGTGTAVATVDGVTINEAEVTVLRYSYEEGTGYDAESFRVDLTNMIYIEAQKNAAAEDFGLTNLDDPDVIEAKIQNPTPDEAQIFETVAADPDRTDATIAAVAEQLVIRDAITAELADDVAFLTDIFENQPELVTQVCARHILVATPEEAEAVSVRLDAGEDFATVATEVSLDTGSVGGQLPCPTPAATYVQEFSHTSATLPIGEVSAPVPTEFGWHIIIVDERTAPETVDALIADPMAYLHISAVSSLWTPWVNEAITSADIVVDPLVGTWDDEAFGILPPPAG